MVIHGGKEPLPDENKGQAGKNAGGVE